MARAPGALAVVVAWALPAAATALALTSGPSDGTEVSPPAATAVAPTWGDSVTVVRTHGETALRPGNVVTAVDGRPWGAWLGTEGRELAAGDTVTYSVLQLARGPAVELQVDVRLTDTPVGPALTRLALPLVVAGIALLVGSVVALRRPGQASSWWLLTAVSLLSAGAVTTPFGVAVVDAARAGGLLPHLAADLLFAAGATCLVGVAVTLSPARARWWWLALTLPALAYAAWLVGGALPRGSTPFRLQGVLAVAGPAAVGAAAAAAAVLVLAGSRAPTRPDRLAARLALLTLLGVLGVRLLLVDGPVWLVGQSLVRSDVVTALLAVTALAGVAVALLRRRLEVVEPTVRRSLFQAALVAGVGAAFLAGAGLVDRTFDRSFESMLAGGVIALLLLPVALAAQRWLGRRLYGDRDLPRQVVAELRRLDPSASPVEALTGSLTLLSERLRLSYAALDAPGVAASVGEARGDPVTIELVAGGSRLGHLVLETAPERDPFGAGDRPLLEDVGAEVGALVQAVVTGAELQRARERLVTAREEERRRLRQDLHDGLGPSLATMAMRLETARDLIDADPAGAAALVDRLSDRARDDIAEIRRLVEGLRPPALDQLGLVPALRVRADEHNAAAGDGLRWTVDADGDLAPLPAAVEVAAYRIAVEAATNAVRHSGGHRCSVSLRRDGDALHLRVTDDGVGLPERPRPGVGLTSMRERAAELGGRLAVTGGPSGTVVDAVLPLDEGGGA